MSEKFNRPISREDLLSTVEMALRKASRLWPRRHRPGDHVRLKPVAKAVVEHIELRGMRCFGRAPGRGHSTPDSWGGLRKKDPKGGEGD
ncbi:MAG: hypothetical protein OXC15_20240 [Rhodospirillaceae bacterium]|nr:hypothetical protein [Rhodospirillaceae bacterium]